MYRCWLSFWTEMIWLKSTDSNKRTIRASVLPNFIIIYGGGQERPGSVKIHTHTHTHTLNFHCSDELKQNVNSQDVHLLNRRQGPAAVTTLKRRQTIFIILKTVTSNGDSDSLEICMYVALMAPIVSYLSINFNLAIKCIQVLERTLT